MPRYSVQNKRPALTAAALRDLALAYVGRFATSAARLERYLARKLKERGWAEEQEPDIAALAARFAELGYLDDAAYARMKGAAMQRRGLGAGRIRGALAADGIKEDDRANAMDEARAGQWDAANTLARKKRIGPYALEVADRVMREKQIAAFVRAGHDFATARAWIEAAPGEFPERSEE